MTDRFVVRAVVLGLIAAVIGCLAASLVLALDGRDIPELLKYVASASVGALVGLLGRTESGVQPVAVVDQPVATVDVQPKKRRDGGAMTLEGILVVLLLIGLALWLGLAFHPLWFLLLLLIVFVVLT